MATNWDSEMQDKFDKLQAALTDEFRTQFKKMGAELEERLEQRLDTRLGHRLNVQAEQLREIVKTAAENYGGVLDGLKADLSLIRFRGHLPKGGYDGTHGIKQGRPASAAAVQ